MKLSDVDARHIAFEEFTRADFHTGCHLVTQPQSQGHRRTISKRLPRECNFKPPQLLHPPPHIEVPLSPFARSRAKGERQYQINEAEPSPSRSGSNEHDGGNGNNLPNSTTSPAPGVVVDPTQQDTAQRPPTRTLNYKGPHTPQPHRAAIPYCLSPNTQGSPATTVNSGPRYSEGKAARRQISRQSSKPILLHSPPAALFQISRQSSKPILLHSPPAALLQISRQSSRIEEPIGPIGSFGGSSDHPR